MNVFRYATSEDIVPIIDLLNEVHGDSEKIIPSEMLVALDDSNNFIGCGRIKKYIDCYELASIAITEKYRNIGIGYKIVSKLLEDYKKTLYLVCASDTVNFFKKF